MRFRRLVIVLIIAVIAAAFFTKPGKEKLINTLQPVVDEMKAAPVVNFTDKIIFTNVEVVYVDAKNPVNNNGRTVAPAKKEKYIGVFGRFWKVNE